MVKELIFHLGDRKTGSTAIQDALVRGDITCPTHRLFFPAATNHIPLAKTLSMPTMAKERKPRFTKVAKRIAAADADIAIISAEHFEVVDPVVLQQTIATFFPDLAGSVRLIAYVRPHADRLVSNYAEQIKLGQFDGTLDDFHTKRLAENPLNYIDRFTHWQQVFGDAFTLRPFVRSTLHGNDIVQDFAQFVLGDADFFVAPSPPSNPSMSVQDLAVMRAFHAELADLPALDKFQIATGKKMGQLMAAQPAPDSIKLKIHKTLADAVQTAYRADAQALDAAFFAPDTPMQDALQKSCETAIPTAQSTAPADHLSPSTQRIVTAWAGMLRALKAPDSETLHTILRSGPQAVPKPAAKPAKSGGGKGKKTKGKSAKKSDPVFNEDDLFDLL